MVLHQVVMDEHEYQLLEAVLDAAHTIRIKSKDGVYKKALNDVDAPGPSKELRTDMGILVLAAKAARPSDDPNPYNPPESHEP